MSSGTEEARNENWDGWEQIGRAAEDFARRVARDATRYAERLQEHSSELAHDVARGRRREHHRGNRHHWRTESCRTAASEDVRRVFDDIRGVVADVLDGIDELIERVFPQAESEAAAEWQKVVSNRDVSCAQCGSAVAAGADAYLRRADGGVEYRCAACGAGTGGDA